MNVILLFAAMASVCAYEVPGLVRNRLWRDLLVFSLFTAFVFTLFLLMSFGVKLPNPAEWIDAGAVKLLSLLGMT